MLADRTVRIAAVLATSLALVACGQTTRAKPTAKATPRNVPSVPATVYPAPTTSAPATESASAEPSASGGSSSAPAPGGNEVTTDTGAIKFVPATLTVKKGTKVTWTADQSQHSVTSGEAGKQDKSGPMNSPIGFTTYSVTFTKPGTYKYFCIPHASLGMVGEIVVT